MSPLVTLLLALWLTAAVSIPAYVWFEAWRGRRNARREADR